MGRIDLFSSLLNNLVKRTLVGDTKRSLPEHIIRNASEPDEAFRAFLEHNSDERELLNEQMTSEQISVAVIPYPLWSKDYLNTVF